MEYLALSGGGIKGLCLLGSIQYLYENKKIKKPLKGIIGSSVGGLIAALISIGFEPYDLYRLILELELNEYKNLKFLDLPYKWGIDDGNKLINLIKHIIKVKVDENIIFDELYKKFNIELVLTGSNLTQNRIEYFNHLLTPKMKLIDAIRITISYPGLYHPIKLNGDIYVDGALYAPYPIHYFKENVIGIILHNDHKKNTVNNVENYLFAIINSLQSQYEKFYIRDFEKYSIIINGSNIYSMNMNLSKEKKKELYEYGYNETIKHFNENSVE